MEKGMSMSELFETGKVVVTDHIYNTMQRNEQFTMEIYIALWRYCRKDWGCSGEESKAMNDYAVEKGDRRIMAAYDTSEGTVWILTAEDRSATTILFPAEY